MPVYEGIGLINEKNPVVLEIGKAFTKAGFAGEYSPRCIIPSVIRTKEGTTRRLADFKDSADLYQMLVDFLHFLYCRHLLVTPKDRKVVVVESLFETTPWRQTLAKVLYLHYEVLTVLWVTSPVAATTSTGHESALIIDIGSEEVQVIPVFQGVTILAAVVCHELGASAFDRNLKSILEKNCEEKSASEVSPLLTPEVIEDIRVRCCVVTNTGRAKLLQTDPPADPSKFKPFLYELDGHHFVHFKGWVREQAAELWFQNDDLDGISIPLMILEVLSKCPLDTRQTLASSIFITGGTGMLLGLKGRLVKELNSLIASSNELKDPNLQEKFSNGKYNFKIYDPPTKENCANWLGGALYGATDAMSLRGLTKEFFLKNGQVPDWCDLQFNSDKKSCSTFPGVIGPGYTR